MVDDAARDHRLAHAGATRPVAAGTAEQVGDGGRQIVVGVKQTRPASDDAVSVGVRIVRERDVEAVL